jgi:hypothetical protein
VVDHAWIASGRPPPKVVQDLTDDSPSDFAAAMCKNIFGPGRTSSNQTLLKLLTIAGNPNISLVSQPSTPKKTTLGVADSPKTPEKPKEMPAREFHRLRQKYHESRRIIHVNAELDATHPKLPVHKKLKRTNSF